MGCTAAVTAAYKKVEGVKDCKVDFDKGTATVTYDDKKTDEAKLLAADIGKPYKASKLEEKKEEGKNAK